MSWYGGGTYLLWQAALLYGLEEMLSYYIHIIAQSKFYKHIFENFLRPSYYWSCDL